jgi:hypothetical protein
MFLGLSEDAKDGSVQIHFGRGQMMERPVAAARAVEFDWFQWRHAERWISSRILLPERSQVIFGGYSTTVITWLPLLEWNIVASRIEVPIAPQRRFILLQPRPGFGQVLHIGC